MTALCPACGGTDGILGTQAAYFICSNPECLRAVRNGRVYLEIYYLGGKPGLPAGRDWLEAVLASPYADITPFVSEITEERHYLLYRSISHE